MTKIAKLVTATVTTRVVVNTNATEEEIAEAANSGLRTALQTSGVLDFITEIKDDTQVPFGTLKDEKSIIDMVIEQFKKDIAEQDVTAIAELLKSCPIQRLESYLPEE